MLKALTTKNEHAAIGTVGIEINKAKKKARNTGIKKTKKR
jgi:hypothetical protein